MHTTPQKIVSHFVGDFIKKYLFFLFAKVGMKVSKQRSRLVLVTVVGMMRIERLDENNLNSIKCK